MPIGPVQLLVIGFTDPDFHGQIQAELDRLRASETIRILDLALVQKDADGNLQRYQMTDLTVDEAEEVGAVVGALVGLGAGGEEGAELGAVAGAAAGEDGHLLAMTSGTSRTPSATPRRPRSCCSSIGGRSVCAGRSSPPAGFIWPTPGCIRSISCRWALIEAEEAEQQLGSAG